MKLFVRMAVVLVALCALCTSAPALQSPVETSPTLEAGRQRWERLSPEDQARFKQLYERYRSLTEEERQALAKRARRVLLEKERVRAQLPEEARAKLQALAPDKRREVLRDLFEGEAREKGARIREKMPEAWIKRLEEAPPEDRARFLAEFQRAARERIVRGAIDKIGRKLELPAAEVERLKALPEPERAGTVLELRKKLSVRDADQFGLPPGVTPAQWEAWQAMPPEQFFEVTQRYRRERGWQQTDRSSDPKDAPSPEKLRAFRALNEALRPRADELVQLADVSPSERRLRVFELRRARVLVALRENDLATPERLNELAQMPEPEFVRALRGVLPRSATGRVPHAPPGPDAEHRPRRD